MLAPCLHPTQEIRVRTYSNGARHAFKQCAVCGRPTTNAIPFAKVGAPIETLPPYDEELAKVYDEARQPAIDAERQIQQVQHTTEYHDYLRTPAWKRKCESVYEREGGICQGCRMAPIQETHHLTYAHVFDELLFELVGLCSPCHRQTHGLEEIA